MGENISKTKQYIYIAAVAAVVVVACVIFFVNVPLIEKVFQKKEILELKKMEIVFRKNDANKAQKYSELVESFSGEEELIKKAVIKEESIVEFIEEIEKISNIVGNKIEIEHVAEGKKKQQSVSDDEGGASGANKLSFEQENKEDEITMKIMLQGSYNQFLQFYYKLENMPYVFSIDSFSLRRATSMVGTLSSVNEHDKTSLNTGEILISFFAK